MIEGFRQRVRRLAATAHQHGGWRRLLWSQAQLVEACVHQLRQHNAMAMSAALSFRTIFAMVPMIVLMFMLVKPLGLVPDRRQAVHNLLHLVGLTQIEYVPRTETQPSADSAAQAKAPGERAESTYGNTIAPGIQAGADGEGIAGLSAQSEADSEEETVNLADELESLIVRFESALTGKGVGPIGVLVLVWTALTLLTTMERSLNRIFEAPRSRSLGRRVLLYWSVVTLGPLVWLGAAFIGRRAATIASQTAALSWLIGWVYWASPLVVGIALLAGLYCLMPNTRVAFGAAVKGATLAVPAWMVALWAFAVYVERVGGKSIYGAIGIFPLFLMWMNLSWWIFLLGAEIARATSSVSPVGLREGGDQLLLGPWDVLAAVVAIARANAATKTPVPIGQVSKAVSLSEIATDRLLSRLEEAGLVCRVADAEEGSFLLAWPADRMKVSAVLGIEGGEEHTPLARKFPPELAETVALAQRRAERGLDDITISELTRGGEPAQQ